MTLHFSNLFQNAMMTFEDEKLDNAMDALKETDKLCSLDTSFVKSFKSVFRRTGKARKNAKFPWNMVTNCFKKKTKIFI